MEIDDEISSSSAIVVNSPVTAQPGARSMGMTSSEITSSLSTKSYSNVGQAVTSAQPLTGLQVCF